MRYSVWEFSATFIFKTHERAEKERCRDIEIESWDFFSQSHSSHFTNIISIIIISDWFHFTRVTLHFLSEKSIITFFPSMRAPNISMSLSREISFIIFQNICTSLRLRRARNISTYERRESTRERLFRESIISRESPSFSFISPSPIFPESQRDF